MGEMGSLLGCKAQVGVLMTAVRAAARTSGRKEVFMVKLTLLMQMHANEWGKTAVGCRSARANADLAVLCRTALSFTLELSLVETISFIWLFLTESLQHFFAKTF